MLGIRKLAAIRSQVPINAKRSWTVNRKQLVSDFWDSMNSRNWGKLPSYFAQTAVINWHGSNECFSVEEFVLVNSKYPGKWQIELEKLLEAGDTAVSVVRVTLEGGDMVFHATSFFQFLDGKISLLDEYWGEADGSPPTWRAEMGIGRPIAP